MIVSADDLVDFMGGVGLSASRGQARAAALSLDGVVAGLARWAGRPLEPVTVTEVLTADASGRVFPSVTPVRSVVQDPLGPTWTLENGALSVGWPGPVTVTYTGGLDCTLPEYADVRLAILRVAARQLQGGHDDTVQVRDFNVTVPAAQQRELSGGWTDADLAGLSRIRRRVTA